MSDTMLPARFLLFRILFQILSYHSEFLFIYAIRKSPLLNLLHAFLVIHPDDFFYFRLLQGQFLYLYRLRIHIDRTKLVVPEHPAVKYILKGSMMYAYIMQFFF